MSIVDIEHLHKVVRFAALIFLLKFVPEREVELVIVEVAEVPSLFPDGLIINLDLTLPYAISWVQREDQFESGIIQVENFEDEDFITRRILFLFKINDPVTGTGRFVAISCTREGGSTFDGVGIVNRNHRIAFVDLNS